MPLSFNTSPYHDDFDDQDGFLRILFNPGRAVQSRELTQIQTLLQDQVSKFGTHMFVDGSPIINGRVSIKKIAYLELETVDDWEGRIIIGDTSGAIARVWKQHDDENIPIYYYEIMKGSFDATETIHTYDSDDLAGANPFYIPGSLNISGTVANMGSGTFANVDSGVYFIGGTFILTEAQNILVDYTGVNADDELGFEVIETVVQATGEGGTKLLDPASGFYNVNAPGADRYHVRLNFTTKSKASVEHSFISVLKLVDGVVTKRQERTDYNIFSEELSRRTFDESGHYTVNHFPIELKDDPDDTNNFIVRLDPGKAYVSGKEIEKISPTELKVPKARSHKRKTNDLLSFDFGPYLEVESIADFHGVFNVFNKEVVEFWGSGTSSIASARVTHIFPDQNSSRWKIYFDSALGLDIIGSALQVRSQTNQTIYATIYRPTGVTTLLGVTGRPWVRPIEQGNIKDIVAGTVSYYTTKTIDVTVTGSSITVPSGDGNVDWDWVYFIYDDTGNEIIADTFYDVTMTGSDVTITFTSNGWHSHDVQIVARLFVSQAEWRTKTLAAITQISVTLSSDNTLILPNNDVYRITGISGPDSVNLIDNFKLDSGAKDTFYDNAFLTWDDLVEANSYTNGQVFTVSYEYFSHTSITSADLFAVNSYSATVDYQNIPTYQSENEVYNYDLRDCIDFRPTTSDFDQGFYLPDPGTNVQLTYDYYLPRNDKVYLSEDGLFGVSEGFSEAEPITPQTIIGTMPIYTLEIPAYTFSAKDTKINFVENKRYTMRDIGKIESRISRIEYYTALSLLEKSAEALAVTDSEGRERYKNGYLVDNFTGHGIGDVFNLDYYIAIDQEENFATTPFESNNLGMHVSSSSLMNYESCYTLPYTLDEGFIQQTTASQILNVNPYETFTWVGMLRLSPESDTWFEQQRVADVIINADGNNDAVARVNQFGNARVRWNEWQTNWSGWSGGQGETRRGPSIWWQTRTSGSTRSGSVNRSGTRRWLSISDIRTEVNDLVIDATVIPIMRSIPVLYTATMMKPNTQLNVYFDNVKVNEYCDNLLTDNRGECFGIFTIPSNDTLSFRTGTRNFEMMDFDTDEPTSTLNTWAKGKFTSQGTLNTWERTILSTFQVVDNVVDINEGGGNVSESRGATAWRNTGNRWRDPVAQSFMIESQPGGVMIDSIDLYFFSKNQVGDLPVKVEIMEMVNGYPSTKVVPHSQTMLYPEDVLADTTGQEATRFMFRDPIYLLNNVEYCFKIESDSSDYNIWISEMGQLDYNTNELITAQPYLGSIFKSQNSTTWDANQGQDVKFKLNKCVYSTVTSETVTLSNDPFEGTMDITSFMSNVEAMEIDGCSIQWQVIVDNDVENPISVLSKENYWLNEQYTLDGSHQPPTYLHAAFSMIGTVSTTNPNITPIIPKDRLSVVAINNLVWDGATEERNKKGVYISRPVELVNKASDLVTYLSVMQPAGCSINVYYDTGIVTPRYIKMEPDNSIGPDNSEVPWTTTGYNNGQRGTYLVKEFEGRHCYFYDEDPVRQVTQGYNTNIYNWDDGVTDSVNVSNTVSYVDANIDSDANNMFLININDAEEIIKDYYVSAYDLSYAEYHNAAKTYMLGEVYMGTAGSNLDYKFYRIIMQENGTLGPVEIPLLRIEASVDGVDGGNAIFDEPTVTWRPMKNSTPTVENTLALSADGWIENTYSPERIINDDFTSFRIKVEMTTGAPQVKPAIKELRTIAVT